MNCTSSLLATSGAAFVEGSYEQFSTRFYVKMTEKGRIGS
jgi:hypothetical protein